MVLVQVMGAILSNFWVLGLVMGVTLSSFCGASANHGCHSGQFFVELVLDMGVTLSNFCGASASHGCYHGQFL